MKEQNSDDDDTSEDFVTGQDSASPASTPMPPLLRGRRRTLMALLVVTALAHSACAVEAGLLVGELLGDAGQPRRMIMVDLAALAMVLAGLAITRYADRVIAEKLGQDYVRQLRRGLVAHAMTSPSAPSLGITIARSTNDLASVRNWVSLGIAPLVALVPLLLGSLAVLAVLDPALAAVVGVPLALLSVALLLISGPAFERARDLRRRRGSLAARVADTVTAAPGIAAAGGVERELNAVDRAGDKVVDAAVHRARTAGALRAVSLIAPLAGSAGAAVLGAFGLVSTATVAVALTIVGILAGPVGELGRTVEYRQNYKAARRIIAPLLAESATTAAPARAVGGPAETPIPDADATSDAALSRGGRVIVRSLPVGDTQMADLVAAPGDRILVRGTDSTHVHEVFAGLAIPAANATTRLCVDGDDLAEAGSKRRRRHIGCVQAGSRLERGTIARAVRYRRPDLDPGVTGPALAAVGLSDRVAGLPDGERTLLRRGGHPLTRQEIARLGVARAALGQPPLLLLEHIDDDLGADGRDMLRAMIADYPGVIVIATDRPASLLTHWTEWNPQGAGVGRGEVGPVIALHG